jgi:hypothetical protein
MAVAKRRQAEAAATIPNRRCGQKYRLPNCRQRVSNPLTFITFLWYTRRRSGCLFIFSQDNPGKAPERNLRSNTNINTR